MRKLQELGKALEQNNKQIEPIGERP